MSMEERKLAGKALAKPAGRAAAPAHAWRQAIGLAALLALAGMLPVWIGGYLPLYDYQNHLLEAQVTAYYSDPELGYASFYQIREGWFLRSNALTTLLMIGLGGLASIELAGKLVLSGYVLLLSTGSALLLAYLKRPLLLLLLIPLLTYNFTYTMGLLNWSYAFALLPWAALFYYQWRDRAWGGAWLGLTLTSILIYTSHLLGWGILMLVILTLACAGRLDVRRYLVVCLALAGPVPLLLVTRPWLALSLPALAAGLWAATWAIRRFGLRPWQPPVLGLGALGLFFLVFRLFREPIRGIFPDIGYSQYTKAASLLQIFSLPYYAGIETPWLDVYNLLALALVGCLLAMLLYESVLAYRLKGSSRWGWWAATGLLCMAYFLLPTRTADIITTEPRVLLVGFWAFLMGVYLPPVGTLRRTVIAAILVGLAIMTPAAAALQTIVYNEAASEWGAWLREIPVRQRVLVLTAPHDPPQSEGQGQTLARLRIAQVFDRHQFAPTYALEQGGFVSNTFFNGPLLPYAPQAIPPYWWSEFKPEAYVERYCDRFGQYYDYVLAWNPESRRFGEELGACFGEPLFRNMEMGVWKIPPY
jgi:hypothetical protein